MLHRFFLSPECLENREVYFPREVSHHIRRVLRQRAGDLVVVLDGSGQEWVVRLEAVGREVGGVVVEMRENQAEPDIAVTLYQGLVKGVKLETILQKCTELGVTRFVPVITTRSVPPEIGEGRWKRFFAIVREAAEQCGRGRIPTVEEPVQFAQAVQSAREEGPMILLWEEERETSIGRMPRGDGVSIGLFVGPEGGFTREEATAVEAAGGRVATLGPRMLRAETAAIVGSALILADH
ncbi:MAG: RsmE family RNA methyltransferase [Chloroflexota bacterium]|nr:MAG: 16S rRNA (uracil(1498)-N(3))-methyltransferase [Chloroflexota bacterium]